MIATRQITLAILAAVLFCPSVVFGWILVVGNTTPYPAWVTVSYPGCSSDNVVIQPSKQANIDAKGCLVNEIGVALVTVPGDASKNIHLNWQVPGHRDFWITIAKQPNGGFSLNADYGKGPIQEAFVKPIEKAFVQLGQDIDTHVLKPTEKAFVQLGHDINKEVIQPINFNVIKPIVGIGDTIGNIVSMAILIKSMVGPIKQTVAHITTQIDTLSGIKNGKDIVDPVFDILQELTTLPPHFQAILDKIAGSMSSIEDIVRPSSGRDADKIKQAAVSMQSISASVDQMTRKIAQLNQMLHVRVKTMAESANEVTNEIIEIIK